MQFNFNRFPSLKSIFMTMLCLLLFLAGGSLIKKIKLKGDAHVKIEIELRNYTGDTFYLYYLPVSETDYSDEKSFANPLKGVTTFQKTYYALPDSLPIKRLRFDLGANVTQKQIWIKSMVVSYNDQEILLYNPYSGTSYFSTNEFVKEEAKGLFTLNAPVKGNYDPGLYSKDFESEYLDLLKARKQIPFPYLISFVLVFTLYIYLILYSRTLKFAASCYTFASCFFVILLFLPLLDETFHLSDKTNSEKRKLAERPVMSFSTFLEYPKQFEVYYNDNFGFRSSLVKLGSLIKYYWFRTSIVPQSAAVGTEDWMYLNGKFNGVTKDLTKENLYTEKSLRETMSEWQRRKVALAQDSIAYYRCFWPDKHCIYPEYMPFCMKIINKDTLSRCDQAIQFLKNTNSDLKIIDVREALFAAKEKSQIYQKYDSHWNSSGAFVGYTCLLNEIARDFPELKPHPENDFNITGIYEGNGDLAEMLGVPVMELLPSYVLKSNNVKINRISADGFPPLTQIYENEGAATPLTLLIYRDSFSSHVMPFLNLHFRKVVALWNIPYTDDMAKKVGADIVVETYVSRFF